MQIDWKKAIGYGVLIWILIFVIVSIFIAFNIYGSTLMGLVMAIIGGVLAYIFAGKVKLTTSAQALTYGFIWLVCGVILDALITTHFNPAIFSDWTMWVGYMLGLLAPLLQVKKS